MAMPASRVEQLPHVFTERRHSDNPRHVAWAHFDVEIVADIQRQLRLNPRADVQFTYRDQAAILFLLRQVQNFKDTKFLTDYLPDIQGTTEHRGVIRAKAFEIGAKVVDGLKRNTIIVADSDKKCRRCSSATTTGSWHRDSEYAGDVLCEDCADEDSPYLDPIDLPLTPIDANIDPASATTSTSKKRKRSTAAGAGAESSAKTVKKPRTSKSKVTDVNVDATPATTSTPTDANIDPASATTLTSKKRKRSTAAGAGAESSAKTVKKPRTSKSKVTGVNVDATAATTSTLISKNLDALYNSGPYFRRLAPRQQYGTACARCMKSKVRCDVVKGQACKRCAKHYDGECSHAGEGTLR